MAGSHDERRHLDVPVANDPFATADDDDDNGPGDSSDDDDGLVDVGDDADSVFVEDGEDDVQAGALQLTGRGATHRFTVATLRARVQREETDFGGRDALNLLHSSSFLDYGSEANGSRTLRGRQHGGDPFTGIATYFYLDFLSIIGRPGQVITRPETTRTVNLEFIPKQWRTPYAAKHVRGIDFGIRGRTFRFGTANSRDKWFIVMHPRSLEDQDDDDMRDDDGAIRQSLLQEQAKASAMTPKRAYTLFSLIRRVMTSELPGCGMAAQTQLSEAGAISLNHRQLADFQRHFHDAWPGFVSENRNDRFWAESVPAFHVYDYGQNQNLDIDRDAVHEIEEPDYDEDDQPAGQYTSWLDEGFTDVSGLEEELESRYDINAIDTTSYALAVTMLASGEQGEQGEEGPTRSWAFLADRGAVEMECGHGKGTTFYPLAFNPRYGNFQTDRPPVFLEAYMAAAQEHLSLQHLSGETLHLGAFQGYSNIKRHLRHTPEALLATKGIATGALTIPRLRDTGMKVAINTRETLLKKLKGTLRDPAAPATPREAGPEDRRPFGRERRQVDDAIDTEEYAFRMEQVLSVSVTELERQRRSFHEVFFPLRHMIYRFTRRPDHLEILHCFRPEVFPGILSVYATIFDKAIQYFAKDLEGTRSATERKQRMAICETIALLDRLGSHCFTGDPRVLPSRILHALGTTQALARHAWPQVDRLVLDMKAPRLRLDRWPRHDEGEGGIPRPRLMHTASIRYYYGAEMARRAEVDIWIHAQAQDLAADGDLRVPAKQLIGYLWVSEMRSLVAQRITRALRSRSTLREATNTSIETCHEALAAWADAASPFSDRKVSALMTSLEGSGVPPSAFNFNKSTAEYTANEYAKAIVKAAREKISKPDHYSWVCHKGALWLESLSVLLEGCAVHSTMPTADYDKRWADAIMSAFIDLHVEYVPENHSGSISTTKMRRLWATASHVPWRDVTGPPSKRRRLEAEDKSLALRRQAVMPPRRIRFRSELPFTAVPEEILVGWKEATRRLGDEAARTHFTVALGFLKAKVRDPVCQLILISAITIASSSPSVMPSNDVRPYFVPIEIQKSRQKRRKEVRIDDSDLDDEPPLLTSGSPVAAYVTLRLMWHAYPELFDDDSMAGVHHAATVGVMIKIIEQHKYANIRTVVAAKLARNTSQRPNPHMRDIRMFSREQLAERLRHLTALMGSPEAYLKEFFTQGNIDEWALRCHRLIKSDPVPAPEDVDVEDQNEDQGGGRGYLYRTSL